VIVAARSERSLSLLSTDKVRAIHEASLRILSGTGVAMPLAPERQTRARELGLLVDSETHRVRFPPALVAEAIDRAPSSYTLYCAKSRPTGNVLRHYKRRHFSDLQVCES
jgi:trimethylamine--corrinoid protein Co-methyltransferase